MLESLTPVRGGGGSEGSVAGTGSSLGLLASQSGFISELQVHRDPFSKVDGWMKERKV